MDSVTNVDANIKEANTKVDSKHAIFHFGALARSTQNTHLYPISSVDEVGVQMWLR